MRTEKRDARMAEIEAVAYALFAEHGFEGTSMLAIAKAAKASNETMYRWYGDKNGLFESMVRRNAAEVRALLTEALQEDVAPLEALGRLAPVLLGMLLSDRAILLNRAAASDPTGALGQLLAKGGREDVLPLIQRVLKDAAGKGEIKRSEEDVGQLFLHLLVGDQQIRRVIGTLAAPSEKEIAAQATRSMARFLSLCAVG